MALRPKALKFQGRVVRSMPRPERRALIGFSRDAAEERPKVGIGPPQNVRCQNIDGAENTFGEPRVNPAEAARIETPVAFP